MADRIVYRCRKCGKYAPPYQVEPVDDGPPRGDCSCYMGPKWERGVWISVEVTTGVPTRTTENPES